MWSRPQRISPWVFSRIEAGSRENEMIYHHEEEVRIFHQQLIDKRAISKKSEILNLRSVAILSGSVCFLNNLASLNRLWELRWAYRTDFRLKYYFWRIVDFFTEIIGKVVDLAILVEIRIRHSSGSCVKLVQWNVYFWRLLCGTAVNRCTGAISLRSKLIYRFSRVFEKVTE